ncbi:hypothetical protein [Emticicia sp. SJ17W-69]|uniref:hypothetical protein n=1 Tax=Emticicia sp. SJ17W-69 TaxID=3421657 RepID=UPI003EB69F09
MTSVAAYNLIGTHINSDFFAVAGLGIFPSDNSYFTEEENKTLEQMKQYKNYGTAYLDIQVTRPLTVGTALRDSPIGQLAWMIEKYKEWINSDKDLPEDAIDIDQLLPNVSLYWFNQLCASIAEILAENMSMAFDWGIDNSQKQTNGHSPKFYLQWLAFEKQKMNL